MLRNQDHAYRSMQPSCQTQKIDTFRRAAKSAVGVPEILAIIFHFLSNADIAACRLVNKSWNLTSADAILARSNNLLHVVLIVSEAVNNLTSSFMSKFSKSSRINEELIKHALELAVTRSGVDSKACSVQREIDSLIETHPIIHSLSNSGGNGPANMYLVPITLQCVDHNISQDSQTLVRKFVPTTRYYECAETHTPSSGDRRNFPSSNTACKNQCQKTNQPLPHFISENNYINDSCIQAFISVNTRRGASGGIKFMVKCLTGSPFGSTGIFSRDTRSFLMDNGTMNSVRASPIRSLSPVPEDVMRDGYVGSLRDGCFGSDFTALLSSKPWTLQPRQNQPQEQHHENFDLGAADDHEYRAYIVGENGVVEPVFLSTANVRRQSFSIEALYVTDDWLATKADPLCRPATTGINPSRFTTPVGSIYCRVRWSSLQRKCISKGLDLERAGFTDKTLFYLRKYIFSNENPPGNSLVQALKLVMYVWADKLSYYLDHDFKNKMKQAEIITKMHFPQDIMISHLQRLRTAAVEKYLDNPIGIKYLQVTGFSGDFDNVNALFGHLSLPEVHTTRSKSFHETITRCVNMDSLEF